MKIKNWWENWFLKIIFSKKNFYFKTSFCECFNLNFSWSFISALVCQIPPAININVACLFLCGTSHDPGEDLWIDALPTKFKKFEFWKKNEFLAYVSPTVIMGSLKKFQPNWSSRLASYSWHINIYIWVKSFIIKIV